MAVGFGVWPSLEVGRCFRSGFEPDSPRTRFVRPTVHAEARTAMERVSVPFSYSILSSTWTSFTRVSGLLRVEGDSLVVEFREKNTDFNTMAEEQSPLREVRVPLTEVETLEVRRRFPWGSRIILTAHTLAALEGLPNCDGPTARFDIAWRDRTRARELAATTSLLLIERSLRELSPGDPL